MKLEIESLMKANFEYYRKLQEQKEITKYYQKVAISKDELILQLEDEINNLKDELIKATTKAKKATTKTKKEKVVEAKPEEKKRGRKPKCKATSN